MAAGKRLVARCVMRAGTWTRSTAAGAAAVARRQLFHAPRSSRQSPIPQPKTASAPEPLGFEPNLGQAGPDPSRWRTDVPQYAAVEYAEIYPGVDLVFHAQPGALRHDFVVSVTGTH